MAEQTDKEIIARSNSGLPTAVDTTKYGIELGEEDRVMPRLVLLQPTSKVDGAGKYYLSLTGQFFDEIEAVAFQNIRGRVMFDPDMSKQESLCGSNDRLVPSSRFEKPMAPRCVECKWSKRGYKEEVLIGNKKVYQECQETMALKAMFVDTLMPFAFVGRKSSLFPINQFLTGVSFDATRLQKPLCCFPFKLTVQKIEKANQKYYVPVITRLAHIERDEFVAMMNKFQNFDIDDSFDAEETAKEDTPF